MQKCATIGGPKCKVAGHVVKVCVYFLVIVILDRATNHGSRHAAVGGDDCCKNETDPASVKLVTVLKVGLSIPPILDLLFH